MTGNSNVDYYQAISDKANVPRQTVKSLMFLKVYGPGPTLSIDEAAVYVRARTSIRIKPEETT